MSASKSYQFFQLVTERRFTEAERHFIQIRNKVKKNEWHEGYLQALNGIILVLKSNEDRYAFLNNIDLNKGTLQEYTRDFSKYAKNDLHADYDRGFFSAWIEFFHFLSTKGKTKK